MPALAQVIPADPLSGVGVWVAALLTLAVLSHALGSNPASRLAQHLLVGVAAGYAAAVIWTGVLLPRLILLAQDPIGRWPLGLFVLLGVLLLARSVRPMAGWADLPLAVLIGTGAGLTLAGALSGTLVAQVRASIISVAPAAYGGGITGWAYALDALLLVVGTVATVSAYRFRANVEQRSGRGAITSRVLAILGGMGRVLILVLLGALLAGAFLSFFMLLIGRLDFLITEWGGLVWQSNRVGVGF